MSRIDVVERVERVADTCASATREHADLKLALSDLARIESWAAARRAQIVSALAEQPTAFPEADIADTTGCTLNAATRETERADTLGHSETFADALDHGDIRPGHVDALTRARNQLTPEQAASLLDDDEALAATAATTSVREFDQHLKRRIAELQSEADRARRLEQQRRATRLRTWVDESDGMWCLTGRFDPRLGKELHRLIDQAGRARASEPAPDTAPTDPRRRRQHLDALAFADLLLGNATSGAPGAPIVVVDATTATTVPGGLDSATARGQTDHGQTDDGEPGTGRGPIVDWGLPVELPHARQRDVFDAHDPDVVIVADGVVLHAPGRLNLGRTTRLANRAQRRALAALYPTCAVPGCSVHYDRCRLHHVIWWRHGGRTDLDNLLPVCQHHHTRLHDDGWDVTLGPNRELAITLPDGRTLRSGPPRRSAASRGPASMRMSTRPRSASSR
ncbi:MAG: HNH endonuclease [Actinomycetota bacterium]